MRLFLALIFISGFVRAQQVYRTPSGTKYHLANCRMVKNVSSALTIDKAQRQGLTPCNICKPPYNSSLGFYSVKKNTAGVNAKNRCKGITKSGTRCKRYTRIGNDYCFQHKP